MGPHDAGVEDELCQPLPRRPRWRRASWRLWLRVALFAPVTLLLGWALLHSSWLLVLAVLGTPVQARLVERTAAPDRYTVTVEYPTNARGAVERKVLEVAASDWGGLLRTPALPALRLGRGPFSIVRVEEDGRALTARDAALWLGIGVGPSVLLACALMWGRLARELWLVAWGRPVRGRVRSRTQQGSFVKQYAVSYEYREAPQRGGSATLYGTTSVPRAAFEATQPGQSLTVLHALWNPRWHVAYPFARFIARR